MTYPSTRRAPVDQRVSPFRRQQHTRRTLMRRRDHYRTGVRRLELTDIDATVVDGDGSWRQPASTRDEVVVERARVLQRDRAHAV